MGAILEAIVPIAVFTQWCRWYPGVKGGVRIVYEPPWGLRVFFLNNFNYLKNPSLVGLDLLDGLFHLRKSGHPYYLQTLK